MNLQEFIACKGKCPTRNKWIIREERFIMSEIVEMFTLYCFISALLPVSTIPLINSLQYVYEARCVVDIIPGDDHMTADSY
jgi:hypothetical protein